MAQAGVAQAEHCDWDSVIKEMTDKVRYQERLNAKMKSCVALLWSMELAANTNLSRETRPLKQETMAALPKFPAKRIEGTSGLAEVKQMPSSATSPAVATKCNLDDQADVQMSKQNGATALSTALAASRTLDAMGQIGAAASYLGPCLALQRLLQKSATAQKMTARLQGQAAMESLLQMPPTASMAAAIGALLRVPAASHKLLLPRGADSLESFLKEASAAAYQVAATQGHQMVSLQALTSTDPPRGLTMPCMDAPLADIPLPRFLQPQDSAALKTRGAPGSMEGSVAQSVANCRVNPPSARFDFFRCDVPVELWRGDVTIQTISL